MFLTLEGPDGAGKTTQASFLADYFKSQNREVLFTREPGGTSIGEAIRGVIIDPTHKEMEPVTEALLYAACRSQLINEVIIPALKAGKVVISDRYLDSSVAYQAYGRGLDKNFILGINQTAMANLPDITFFLDVPPKEGLGRKAAAFDRIESEPDEFHKRVYQGYVEICKDNPTRIKRIDARLSQSQVFEQILSYIAV